MKIFEFQIVNLYSKIMLNKESLTQCHQINIIITIEQLLAIYTEYFGNLITCVLLE